MEKSLQVPGLTAVLQTHARFVGETQHVFSHLKHIYRVFVAVLPAESGALSWTHCLPDDGKR